jgi:multiple sugar transport system permease protein
VKSNKTIILFLLPTVAYLVCLSVFPLLYSLYLAFQEYHPTANSYSFVGLRNFTDLFQDPDFFTTLWNTLIFTASTVSIEIVLGLGLALLFSIDFAGRYLFRTLIITPMMITPMVIGLMWRFILDPDSGLLNYWLGLLNIGPFNFTGDPSLALATVIGVDIWQWTPFTFLIFLAGIQALPEEVFEAAAVDGATRLQLFRHITLPLLGRAFTVALLFRGIDAFRSFDLVYGLTYGGPGRDSATLSFYAFENAFNDSRFGYSSAIVYVMVMVIIVVTSLFFRLTEKKVVVAA